MSQQPFDSGEQNANLPATIPSAALVLHRTQTTLGLLRDVVQESSAEYWYEQGTAANAVKKWTSAIYNFEHCLRLDSMHWRGTLSLATAFAQLQQGSLAAELLLRVYENNYSGNFSSIAGGFSLEYWGILQNQLIIYSTNNPSNFSIMLALALMHLTRNELPLGRALLDSMMPLQENLKELAYWHRLSGAISWRQGEYNNCLTDYNLALSSEDKLPFTYYDRGLTKSQLEDYIGALQDFDLAIAIDQNYFNSFFERGLAKAKLKNLSGALDDYSHAIILNPNYETAYNFRGYIKSSLQDYTGAANDFGHSIQLNPKSAISYANRGAMRRKLNDLDGALIDFGQAIVINLNYATYYYNRALIRRDAKDYAGVIMDCDQAIKLNDKAFNYYVARGDAKNDLMDYNGAVTDYDQAIVLNPNSAPAYFGRAEAKEKSGNVFGAGYDRRIGEHLEDWY